MGKKGERTRFPSDHFEDAGWGSWGDWDGAWSSSYSSGYDSSGGKGWDKGGKKGGKKGKLYGEDGKGSKGKYFEDGGKGKKGKYFEDSGKGKKGNFFEDTDWDDLSRRLDADRRVAKEEAGRHCTVKKHSGMGCAVVTMVDQNVRKAILKEDADTYIDQVKVKVKANVDKETGKDMPYELFIGWGHRVEKSTPLSDTEIVKYFDHKHEELQASWQKQQDQMAQILNVGKATRQKQEADEEKRAAAKRTAEHQAAWAQGVLPSTPLAPGVVAATVPQQAAGVVQAQQYQQQVAAYYAAQQAYQQQVAVAHQQRYQQQLTLYYQQMAAAGQHQQLQQLQLQQMHQQQLQQAALQPGIARPPGPQPPQPVTATASPPGALLVATPAPAAAAAAVAAAPKSE